VEPETIQNPLNGRVPPFRVEVCGTLQDPRLRTEVAWTQIFLVAASGPGAAEVAGGQLFGGAAALRHCRVLPGSTVRVLSDQD
jgi:hypothetical protein